MGSYIEAVKSSITELRTKLVSEYKECRLSFAFVRYTDYDLKDTRTTVLNFTTYVTTPRKILFKMLLT